MQIIFRCPRCEQTNRTEIEPKGAPIACQNCHAPVEVPDDAALDDGLQHCLICQSDDLFIRKDFPQRLGVMIVVIGFLASSVAWYYYEVILAFAILFATAGIDVLLYVFMGEALVCYRCGTHYRQVNNLDQHSTFDLETHEKYRQLAARESRTAGSGQ